MKVAVIGGGPGGMAAAVSAKACGVDEVLLLERQPDLGGVLSQCIHTGFGTQLYGEDYTGGEYGHIWAKKTYASGVQVRESTAAIGLSSRSSGKRWTVDCISSKYGREKISADAVIVASGCRERTLPQMLIPGSRPAGIFTAGTAQFMMNCKNMLPGKSAVIFGSGDIGLIMARRMWLEGIRVRMVLGMKGTGLIRNVTQCVRDFNIPLRYGWTLLSTHGYKRLKGVTVAPLKADGTGDVSKREYIPCDTLLVATGLIPELEICKDFPDAPGLYLCGNASCVHDLADHVTVEGIDVGIQVARELLGEVSVPEELENLRRNKFSVDSGELFGNMVCTACPKGCTMQVEDDPFSVTGNQCEKGIDFARQELWDPRRTVTSVVAVEGKDRVIAVRTGDLIPKEEVPAVMKSIKEVVALDTVRHGDVVARDIGGTGVDLIVTGEGRK